MGVAGSRYDTAGQRADHGASSRICERDRVPTGISSQLVLLLSASDSNRARLGSELGFHDFHLDIFQQQSFNVLAHSRQGPVVDQFSDHGQPGARHEFQCGLFPIAHFTTDANTFWKSTPRDTNWWNNWFTAYQAFANNYADLATQSGAQMLILGGGTWISPALPNGTLSDGSASVSRAMRMRAGQPSSRKSASISMEKFCGLCLIRRAS